MPESWGYGALYSLRLASSFIRVTARGLQYSTTGEIIEPKSDSHLWSRFECDVVLDALCRHTDSNMQVFSTGPVTVSENMHSFSGQHSNSYMEYVDRDMACNRSYTGRTLTTDHRMYSVSLCDMLDSNLDMLVLFNSNDNTESAVDQVSDITIYWRRDETPTWLFVYLALTSIYMVSCMAQNMVAIIKPTSGTSKHHFSDNISISWFQRGITILLFVILGCDFFLQTLFDPDGHNTFDLVSMLSDRTLLIHTFVYIACEIPYQCYSEWRSLHSNVYHKTFASNISLILACLLLVSLRVHYTADNPYITILSTLFGVRAWFKYIECCVLETPVIARCMHILDMFMFASMLGNGVFLVEDTAFAGSMLQFMLLFICMLVGSLLAIYNKCGKPMSN